MRGSICAALTIAFIATAAAAQTDVKATFLYSEDQKLPQSDLTQSISPSDEIRRNSYLNAPMTRLEYILSKAEEELNRKSRIASITDFLLPTRFQPNPFRWSARIEKQRITGYARYNSAYGKVLLGYEIVNLGPPLNPIKGSCDRILTKLEFDFPRHHFKDLHHSGFLLGVLNQKPGDEYTSAMKTLASSVIYRVSLGTLEYVRQKPGSKGQLYHKLYHRLVCQRDVHRGPISYHKYSSSSK